MSTRTEQVNVRVRADLLAEIDRLAAEDDRSRSDTIRKLLIQAIQIRGRNGRTIAEEIADAVIDALARGGYKSP